jgi:predicted ATP-dependent endonuclease of OLD family
MNELEQAYISKIHLKNYKSIKNLEIDCHPGLNIIIGQNGSGKTNFVQAIHHVFSAKLHYDLPIGFEFGFDFVNRKHLTQEWTGSIQEKIIDNQLNTHNKIIIYESKLGVTESKIERDGFFHQDIVKELIRFWNYQNNTLEHEIIAFGLPTQLKYLNKLDTVEIVNGPLGMNDNGAIIYIYFPFGSNLNYFEPLMLLLKKQMIQNIKKHFKINTTLAKNLKQFSPIKDYRISQGYNIQQKDDNFAINHVIIEFFVNNNWYSWDELSDGTKRLFYIISQTLHSKGLVVIEEPEIGVHPDQLYKLMDFLKEQSKNKQIIITTHSPDALNILSTSELHKIIVTHFDPEKGTLMHHLSPRKIKKARLYMSTEGLALKDFWVHSNLEALDETTED